MAIHAKHRVGRASVREVARPVKARVQRAARRLGKPLNGAGRLAWVSPARPYHRGNAIIVETVGRRWRASAAEHRSGFSKRMGS